MIQLVRNASPLWALTYADALLPSAAQMEYRLPYKIQNKLESIKVELREGGVPPKAELKFVGLTLTEIESQYFSNSLLYRVYMGWYDFLGVSGSAYRVMQGVVHKAVVDYERGGYCLTLELTSVGTNFLDHPFPSNYDGSSLRNLGLEGALKFIAHMAGLDAVFLGDTLLTLLKEDKALLEEAKAILEAEVDVAQLITGACPASTAEVKDVEQYFAPWVTFFTFPLVASGTKRNLGSTIVPNTPSGLLLYLRTIYRFDLQVSGSYIVFSSVSHSDAIKKELVAPQRYFKYRGGMGGEGGSSAQSALMSAAASGPMGMVGGAFGVKDILHDDPFEDFTVVAAPQLASGNIVAPSNKAVAKKQAVVKDKVYDVSSVNPDPKILGIGTKVQSDAAMERVRANQDRARSKSRGESKEKDVETVLYIPGVQKPTKAFVLSALVNSKALNQAVKVSGAVGAPDLALGMYFYFEGRLRDTGYHVITGLDHSYTRSSGFKTTLYGRLVEDPTPKTEVPQNVAKKTEVRSAGTKYYVRVLSKRGKDKLSRVGGKTAKIGAEGPGVAVDINVYFNGMDDWDKLIEANGLQPVLDYTVVEVSPAAYKRAQEIEKKMKSSPDTVKIICTGQTGMAKDKVFAVKGNEKAWVDSYNGLDKVVILQMLEGRQK